MQSKKPLFLILYILIFWCSLSLNAQTDSLQGKSYDELINLYDASLQKNPVNAKAYATKAYELAKKENNQSKTLFAKYNIISSKYALGAFHECLEDLNEIMPAVQKLKNNLLLFRTYNLRGNSLCALSRDGKGFDAYMKAKQYAKLIKNPIHISTADINIALIKKTHKDYQETINILLENLQLLKKIDNDEKLDNERIILMQLADTYLRIRQPKSAKEYNDLALKKCSKEKKASLYYWALANEAIINYQTKNYQKCIEICNEINEYYISFNKTTGLLTPYFYIGKSNYKLGRFQEAITYLEKVVAISDEFQKNFSELKETHKFLHLSHNELGNSEKASENFIKYSDIDQKNDSTDISLNNRIHKEHDIVPLQEEIALLDDNNQKQRKLATYLYIASGFLLLLLVGFFIWFKRKQQYNKDRFQKLLVTIEDLEKTKQQSSPIVTVVKEASSPITDENALQILKGLETFETKELYLRQDCTLGYVAKKLKTNTSYLSNVINTYKEKPFKTYLTELRINAALIKLKNDDKLRSYTIKAIAEEFGFKRSETFSRAFKAQTDMYPSVYIKSLENQKNM